MKTTLTRFDRLMMAVTFAEANIDVDVGAITTAKKNCKGKACGSRKPRAAHLYNTKAVKVGS